MKVKAILFDLDKTLIEVGDYVDWLKGRQDMVKVYLKHGISAKILIRYTDPGRLFAEMYNELARMFPDDRVIAIQREASNVLSMHELKALDKVRLMPGCLDVLRYFKRKGIKIGVVSLNGEKVVYEALRRTGIYHYIDIYFSRDSPGRPKPYPDHILNCLKELKCNVKEAVFIGDSLVDIEAAKRARVIPIGIATGFFTEEELLAAGAKLVVSSLSELPNRIFIV
ncbi:MAG: hypothetical protein DRN15_03910 [Thermoprotei archaeon]|nr:MAG: hypothetical protein DRM97_08505 [Thermoprotei archaeon]RLF24049.1 MAG: hypothetical protein DRN15_03910 [Thermoprotei archaeon]